MSQPQPRFDDVIHEFIDTVNAQVGVYMDALAGFAGHTIRVERQVSRVMKQAKKRDPGTGETTVVCVSYEDPSTPDVVLNRIVRSDDYLSMNARGGSNERQLAQSIIVFLYTTWELEIRPRLAAAMNVPLESIKSNVMGDLRHVRHAILHTKGILRADAHSKLGPLGSIFQRDSLVQPSYEEMHQLFIAVKQGCAGILLERIGMPPGEKLDVSSLRDIAIQRLGKRS